MGRFGASSSRALDELREYIMPFFEEAISGRNSLHKYIETMPEDSKPLFDSIRYAPEVLQLACSQFVKCDMTPLPETDEVYISHYNMDAGGDQGLFDRHYDGNMRAIPYGAVVRALVYVNADDSYQVVFNDSQVTK